MATESLTGHLPTWAVLQGWSLVWYKPTPEKDPVYLRDRDMNTLYEWHYTPNQGEVWDICRQLMETSG
jgi:hypothetical protein